MHGRVMIAKELGLFRAEAARAKARPFDHYGRGFKEPLFQSLHSAATYCIHALRRRRIRSDSVVHRISKSRGRAAIHGRVEALKAVNL